MKVLFATHNKAKLRLYKELLEKYNFEVLCLDDINLNYDVIEDGNTPEENAYKKAKEYYNISKITTISVDDGLYLDNIPKDIQPGVNVRRFEGRTLSDDEIITHYVDIVNKYGENGKLNGRWTKALAIAKDNEIITHNFNVEKIFVNKISSKRNEGYPMDSMTIVPELNKYTIDLSQKEKEFVQENSYKSLTEFIINNLK